MFSIIKRLRFFFLNSNEKIFIIKNKKVNNNFSRDKKKVILINTIHDYFFLLLTKCITNSKTNYIFIGLDPYIIPQRRYNYFIPEYIFNIFNFFFIKLIKIKWFNLYNAVQIKNILNFNFSSNQEKKNKEIYLRIIKQIKKKEDVLKINLHGINFGSLIYDTYLRFGKSPTVNLEDPFLKKIILNFIRVGNNFNFFLVKNKNNIEALYTMYTSYIHHGLFVRYCIKYKIPVFSLIQSRHIGVRIKQITREDNYSHLPLFLDYKKEFKMLKKKSHRLNQAKKELDSRFYGKIDKALFYVKNKNFSYKKNNFKKYSKKYQNLTGVVFLHDYFDSPHNFDFKAFPDYYEWTIYTLNLIRKYKLNIGIKPHPNAMVDSKKVYYEIRNNYKDLVWIDEQTNNLVFFLNKNFKFGITCNGTIIQELCYFKKIPIFLSSESMLPYLNYKIPINKNDYKLKILDYNKLYLPKNIKRYVLQSFYLSNLNNKKSKNFCFLNIVEKTKFHLMDPDSSQNIIYYSNLIDNQIRKFDLNS